MSSLKETDKVFCPPFSDPEPASHVSFSNTVLEQDESQTYLSFEEAGDPVPQLSLTAAAQVPERWKQEMLN